MSRTNIGKAWQQEELDAFFRAYISVGEDFKAMSQMEGLTERTQTQCRNLFSLHDQFLKNAMKKVEKENFDEALVNSHSKQFIDMHQSLIAAANTISSPSPRLTRSTRSAQKSHLNPPLDELPAEEEMFKDEMAAPVSSSRKRKKPDTPTDYTPNTEERRNVRRTANRKLTYTSLNEEDMFKDVLRQNEDEDEEEQEMIMEEDASAPDNRNEDTDFAPPVVLSPPPRRRGRPPKPKSSTPTPKKTPGKRGRPRKTRPVSPEAETTEIPSIPTPNITTRSSSASITTRSSATTTTTTRSNRRKTVLPQRIPRKTKTELQHLPYNLAPLPIDSLPPNTPNGSTIKRDNFSRNSQLPLKLRKIGTHGTVPNVIKVQDLSGSNEDVQNKIQARAEQFGKLLASNGRRFCACEWFYPTIDCGYFIKNEFMEELRKLNLNHVEKMTRSEWNVVRSVMGQPRRLSNNFLQSERNKLDVYRECVRKFYHETEEEKPHLYIYPQQLKVGEEVLVLHPESNYVHHARILSVIGNDSYQVQVLDAAKPMELTVPDTHVMQTGPIHVNVSKKSFDAISASPNMLFSPGGDMRTQTHINNRQKLIAVGSNGDTLHIGMMPYAQQSFTSPPRPSTANHTPLQNGVTESPSTPIVGVNLFAQQTSAMPQLNLPANLAANVDFKSMAETILKLEKKKELLNEINATIQFAEEHAEQHPDEQVKRTEIDYKIANLVLQLQEIDAQLLISLDSLPMVAPEEATRTKDKKNATQNEPQTPQQKRTHTLFEANRDRASQLIHRLIGEMDMANMSFLSEVDTKNSTSIRQLISDCVAFLLHLETCLMDQQFRPSDAELTLTAGLLALKPKGEPNQEVDAVFEEITSLVSQIQDFVLGGINRG